MGKWIVVGKETPQVLAGGLNRFVAGFTAAMKERGVEVVEIYPGNLGSVGRLSLFRRWLACFRAGFDHSDVDVIDSHFALYGLPVVLGARIGHRVRMQASKPPTLLVHFHGPWAKESRVEGHKARRQVFWIQQLIERLALRGADRVVVLTQAFKVEAECLGARRETIRVIAPGVSESWFQGPPRVSSRDGTIRLLCVRRLAPRMGHEQLIRALGRLNFEVAGRSVELEIVGTGSLDVHLREVVSGLGREGSVKFHGRVSDDEIRRIGSECCGAIVPTVTLEGFGLVVLEAMAMGLPVISTGQGGLSEAMGPWSIPPFVFSLEDDETLRRAIQSIASGDGAELAHSVREYASSMRWSMVADKTQMCVEELE